MGLLKNQAAHGTVLLFPAHFHKICQFPVVGERFPFAGIVQDRQAQRMMTLNPMRLAYGRRLPQGDGIIGRLKFYVHGPDDGLFDWQPPWGVSLTAGAWCPTARFGPSWRSKRRR
jgi:hypothetical protein